MSFWDKWIGKKEESKDGLTFEAHLGRFTDAHKTAEQYEAWDKALIHFDQRDYPDAINEFIHYIKDPISNNVIKVDAHSSDFNVLQGSKTIEIKIKNGQLLVTCIVAHADQLHIGFMRRLLDLNYELKYVRYGLSSEDMITLLFDTALEDASPYKLYFALKELSIHADKQDDLLVGEFDFLKPVYSGNIISLSLKEQIHKLNFLKSGILKSLDILDHGDLKIEQYPAASSYILLALLYKLDYLIKPEGNLMDRLEQIHKIYFSQDNKNLLQKLKSVRLELLKISQLPDEEIRKDLYSSTFTFGITSPANSSTIFEALDREFSNLQWYLDNQYDEYAVAILEYTAGLCLFNYSLPLPIKDLFTMIYRVSEPGFFSAVTNYSPLTNDEGLPDKSAVRRELASIEKNHQKEFPFLSLNSKSLQFDKISTFLYSFCLMIRQINLQQAR
ncbi:MAG: hypothetical protein ABI761_03170 [Saprospiraceae bacterium]